ncbi:hypothetical protein [Hymenobacter sp. BT730]|uniref:hypothetical protein n=1 Tax=Hymenobacter sp. BT730 TaxID=3063332 RepID=UPI0026E056DB|nr:hypothetical protein [Hymenobacter sp. BT730]
MKSKPTSKPSTPKSDWKSTDQVRQPNNYSEDLLPLPSEQDQNYIPPQVRGRLEPGQATEPGSPDWY